jgi:hypothetical protein
MPLNKSWHDYNESLIERGRILMDISLLEKSERDKEYGQVSKVGATFEYSSTYIQFLAFLKIGFKISYRNCTRNRKKEDYLIISAGLKRFILHRLGEEF